MSSTASVVTAKFAPTLTVPSDGDADAVASVNGPFQDLLNGMGASALLAAYVWNPPQCYSTDGVTLVVTPPGNFAVTSGGLWYVLSLAVSSSIGVGSTLGSGLANSTRYYVYLRYNAGSPAFFVSTTAPGSDLAYQAGGTDYRYVTTLITDAGGVILPFCQSGRKYAYFGFGTSATNLILSAVAVGGPTDITPGISWPSFATYVALSLGVSTAVGEAAFGPKSLTATGYTTSALTKVSFDETGNNTRLLEVPIFPGATMRYTLTSGGAATLTAYVMGFSF